MIPKILYTCWLSDISTMPDKIKECVSTQLEHHKDYEHIIIDYNKYKLIENVLPNWVKRAFKQGDYAHVSDYMRTYYLYKYGGIYLDSDVRCIKIGNVFDKYLGFDFFANIEISFNFYDAYDIFGNQYDICHFDKPIQINKDEFFKCFIDDLIKNGNFKEKVDLIDFLKHNYKFIESFAYGIAIDGAMFGSAKGNDILRGMLHLYNSDLFEDYISDTNITNKIHYYPNICNIIAKSFERYGFNYNVELGKTYMYNQDKYVLFTNRFYSIIDYEHRDNINCEFVHLCNGSWRK